MTKVLPQKTSNFCCLCTGSPTFRKMARCTQALDSEVSPFPQISPAKGALFKSFCGGRTLSGLVGSLHSDRAPISFQASRLRASLHLNLPPAVNAAVSRLDRPRRVARQLGGQRFSNARGERGRRGGNQSSRRERAKGGTSAGEGS